MYSKRSPPTVPAGMELPNISIPGICGIASSTGVRRWRRYSSMVGAVFLGIRARKSVQDCPCLSLYAVGNERSAGEVLQNMWSTDTKRMKHFAAMVLIGDGVMAMV